MKGTLLIVVCSLLGQSVMSQFTLHPALQKRGQTYYTTTPVTTTNSPVSTTPISLAPQTSISVHHTIVRNKPAYPFPYVESTAPTDATEDTSYYYTYEDMSEEASKKVTSSSVSTTTVPTNPTTKPTVKSFWNSQKAMLDARRKEGTQKYMSSYSKPVTSKKDTKPTIEFKVREKPKFGQANKNKEVLIPDTKKTEAKSNDEGVLVNKSAKNNNNANSATEKVPEKDSFVKKSASNAIPNQIVGRIGEIPTAQIQSPARAQSTVINSYGGSRSSKFDESAGNVKFVDKTRPLPQPLLQNLQKLQSTLRNSNQPLVLPNNLSPQQLMNIKQQLQTALNMNKQQQQLLNTNQQNLLSNLHRQPATAFIAASPAANTAPRSTETNANPQSSSLLQRLGSLGLNLAQGGLGNGNGLGGLALGRDGGQGFTLNLGPVPDPLTFILQLLSLIPRPLLDLNGRIFLESN